MKYLDLVPPISTASQILKNDFDDMANVLFSYSTDVFQIQHEKTFGQKDFENVTVRITRAINQITSEKLGDDFKQIALNPKDGIEATLGKMWYFDNNYWICVFSDSMKSLMSNCTVRRCNDFLRWLEDDGTYHEEPCIIDYTMARTKETLSVEDPVRPEGYLNIISQLNARTTLIKGNQKFLFGRPNNRVALRVFGNGVQNMLNQSGIDPTSSTVLTLTAGAWEINENLDNLVLGIADYYKKDYTITVSPLSMVGNIGNTYQIDATVYLNDVPTSASIAYSSTASSVASISSSGSVTMISSGSAILSAYMSNASNISASSLVTVSASSTPVVMEEVRITPSENVQILEGDTETFTSYVYVNGVQQANTFSFVKANNNVPIANYVLTTIDGNTISAENIQKYATNPLLINCTSGSYVKQISIDLRGAW